MSDSDKYHISFICMSWVAHRYIKLFLYMCHKFSLNSFYDFLIEFYFFVFVEVLCGLGNYVL